jgi:hypothetical protein
MSNWEVDHHDQWVILVLQVIGKSSNKNDADQYFVGGNFFFENYPSSFLLLSTNITLFSVINSAHVS